MFYEIAVCKSNVRKAITDTAHKKNNYQNIPKKSLKLNAHLEFCIEYGMVKLLGSEKMFSRRKLNDRYYYNIEEKKENILYYL